MKILGMICIIALVIGGTVSAAPATAPSGTFTLYTSESEDNVNLLTNDFMRRTPGVLVKIFRAGSGSVVAKLQAERQAAKIQADVIWMAAPSV